MGDKNVSLDTDESQLRRFTKAVLQDLKALEKMLAGDYFEEDVLRIGAEQEMFLVDAALRPAPIATEMLEAANDERLTTELGRFNLEANVKPRKFTGKCLSQMEKELLDVLSAARRTAKKLDAGIVLAGILPTIQPSDLVAENLTPQPRYREMDRVLTEMHGTERHIQIKGLDELQYRLDGTYIEFSNMSFQTHLQVGISRFARSYNWAQAIAAPVLAAAVNAPILLGHRLWHETRIALFQHATDARSPVHQRRDLPARVNFGERWMSDSVIDALHEDVARYRFILSSDTEEDSVKVLEKGDIPHLYAWQMHNGTIWRWNRACYGILNGKPSLRIEARYLPAGPTVADEMANAAFFLGLMIALPEEFGDVTELLDFDDAKNNFFNAARNGLETQIAWIDGKTYPAKNLILKKLLPLAAKGLKKVKVDAADVKKYLGILEERVRREITGARWMLDSLAAMDENAKPNVKLRALTAAMLEYQEKNEPLHKWKLAEVEEKTDWIDNYRTVEQFMIKDLFTVRPEDVIDLAASLMNWKHIRHVPVEDDHGNLVGVISYRDLLSFFAASDREDKKEIAVRDVMQTDLITVAPDTLTLDALNLMRENDIGCLPVVENEKLLGLITAHDFLTVSTKLFEERLKNL